MAHVTAASAIEGRRSVGAIARGVRVSLGALALALLVLPRAALPGDYYYPEYKRLPVAPVSVVEDVVAEDAGDHPACNPANEACDDPAPAAPAVVDAAPDRVSPSSPLARTD